MQTPTLPVAAAYPWAAWPAPCSWRTRMCRMRGVHERVVRRQDRATRDAEDVLGPGRLQRLDQALRAGDLLAHPASLSLTSSW